jgi:hypothetical protein
MDEKISLKAWLDRTADAWDRFPRHWDGKEIGDRQATANNPDVPDGACIHKLSDALLCAMADQMRAYAKLINVVVSSLVFQFRHPEATQVQAFLHIPRSFVWDFRR